MGIKVKYSNNVTSAANKAAHIDDAERIIFRQARDFMTPADMAGNEIRPADAMITIIDADGQEATFSAAGGVLDMDADAEKIRETYDRKRGQLYAYKLQQALDAANAYADACERCGAQWDRLVIVQFCANTFPDMKVSDALDIAQAVRGRYIK